MKTAIIFGHTSGLGLELSKVFIGKNIKVIGFSRTKSEISSDLIENVEADLSNYGDIDHAVQLINQKYANFDYLIYNAGFLTSHTPENIDANELERIFKVNTIAPIILESKLRQLLLKNGCYVVNITSTCVDEYYLEYEEYAATKATLSKFTSDLQKQFEDSNVRVMEFKPDDFRSNIYKNMTGEKIARNEDESADPKYLAELINYLLELPKNIEVPQIVLNTKY